MDLVFFGIQGCGKGTQAKILQQKHNYKIFETGAELRKISEEESELGKEVKAILAAGNLVPANIVLEILENFVKNLTASDKAIFDGIPRNLEQKHAFDAIMTKYSRKFLCFEIIIPIEETIKRLLARGRHDDNPEAIKARINNFNEKTKAIIEEYAKAGSFIQINGFQTVEEVSKEIEKYLPTS